jgi:hypothetical protein
MWICLNHPLGEQRLAESMARGPVESQIDRAVAPAPRETRKRKPKEG